MTQITKEAIEALESARAHILDAYRIWQADDVSAVPPPKSGAGAVIAKIDAVLSSPIAGKPDMLRLAVAAVLEADKEFRANMPPEWEGDPLSDEIDGLRRVFSALPIAVEGKVKALEWTQGDEGTGYHFAQSSIGNYIITEFPVVGDDQLTVRLLGTSQYGVWFKTIEEAKADAQAHLNTHILSALISSPGKDGGQEVEAVAKLVYEAMRIAAHECDPDREKPQWVEGGNSLMQDQARRIARSISDAHPASTALVERLCLYEEILRVVCHHLELPQSESGPADDLTLYDRALEAADEYTSKADADLAVNRDKRFAAEALAVRLANSLAIFTKHHDRWMERWADDAESSTFSRHTFGDLRKARKLIEEADALSASHSTSREGER